MSWSRDQSRDLSNLIKLIFVSYFSLTPPDRPFLIDTSLSAFPIGFHLSIYLYRLSTSVFLIRIESPLAYVVATLARTPSCLLKSLDREVLPSSITNGSSIREGLPWATPISRTCCQYENHRSNPSRCGETSQVYGHSLIEACEDSVSRTARRTAYWTR